jgi:hypothetical protein
VGVAEGGEAREGREARTAGEHVTCLAAELTPGFQLPLRQALPLSRFVSRGTKLELGGGFPCAWTVCNLDPCGLLQLLVRSSAFVGGVVVGGGVVANLCPPPQLEEALFQHLRQLQHSQRRGYGVAKGGTARLLLRGAG